METKLRAFEVGAWCISFTEKVSNRNSVPLRSGTQFDEIGQIGLKPALLLAAFCCIEKPVNGVFRCQESVNQRYTFGQVSDLSLGHVIERANRIM